MVTLAGGQTTGAATKHDYMGMELGFPWKNEIWAGESLQLDLGHAFNVSGFRDENTVYAASAIPVAIVDVRRSMRW